MFKLQTTTNSKEVLPQDSSRPLQEKMNSTSGFLFLMFCYLYFVQGTIMGIVATFPYVYQSLPDVHTMSLFNSIGLPYSLKFLIAPFLQKFNIINYGKHKTWIIISQILTGLLLFISSFYTEMSQSIIFAWLSIAMMIGMVLQNIALHSLIVKEITCAHQSSMIQSFAQVFGILVGGLLVLKLTSLDFAKKIGLEFPIAATKTVLASFCFFILFPLSIIHLYFQQKVLESERVSSHLSISKIISYYASFADSSTKYFRFCVFVLIFYQGLNFFNSLYDYQLVKAGFSRDTSNTISNIIIIPIIIITFYFKKWTHFVGGHYNALIGSTLISTLLCFYVLFYFPLNPWAIAVWSFFVSLLDSWRFFIYGVMINQFPLHGLSGMYITLLGSFCNFGKLTSFHTQLCGLFGWRQASFFGLSLQLLILFYSKGIFKWMQEGDSKIPVLFQENEALDSLSQIQVKQEIVS